MVFQVIELSIYVIMQNDDEALVVLALALTYAIWTLLTVVVAEALDEE